MLNEFFSYSDGQLHCEGISARDLAERYGTPLYVYSANAFRKQYNDLAGAFADVEPLVCYSVKACSALAILKLLKEEGSGFDCVSWGEILRCLKVGVDPQRIVFAGVGKTRDEIELAIKTGILMFNVESENELKLIASVAESTGAGAGIALRLNPDVDPRTHTYITTGKRENKFGIDLTRAEAALSVIEEHPSLTLKGLHLHIGSQITETSPHADAVAKITPFIKTVRERGFTPEYINVGGGFGIDYKTTDKTPPISAFAQRLVPAIKETGLKMLAEPGRFIAGNSGILLTKIVYLKRSGEKTFAICDAAMNDLLRPSLYSAYHHVWPADQDPGEPGEGGDLVDVVGPICETGDFLATERSLPKLREGELLSVFSAGAYGATMASNYNTRLRPAEVLVEGRDCALIKERETYDDLLRHEMPPG